MQLVGRQRLKVGIGLLHLGSQGTRLPEAVVHAAILGNVLLLAIQPQAVFGELLASCNRCLAVKNVLRQGDRERIVGGQDELSIAFTPILDDLLSRNPMSVYATIKSKSVTYSDINGCSASDRLHG